MMWLDGFVVALQGGNIIWLIVGTFLGLIAGVLPAMGPSFGVALALPFTFGMDPAAAMIMLLAIQAACSYGDSITSILLNVPGGPGSVATCWDGHPMVKQGKGGTAIGLATISALAGGIVSWLSLVVLAGPITALALRIGPPEYFALAIMALGLVSLASKGKTLRGLLMCCMGLLVSFIGQDPIIATTYRYTFGLSALEAGVAEVTGALGIFAIPEIVKMIAEGGSIAKISEINDSIFNGFKEFFKRPLTFLRCSVLGWFVGVMPAIGSSLAGITTYLLEKKYSKESDKFGQGAPAGLMAAEVGKGSCVTGECIPAFTLGIPGSITAAILMAALMVHGLQPGPRFMTSGVVPYTIFAGLLLSQFAYTIVGIFLVRYFVKLVYIPNAVLAPLLAVVVFLGAFVSKNYTPDILSMLGLGVFSFYADKRNFPTVPFILGFLMGPIIETNFHRSLVVGYGSYTVFVSRPISLALLIVSALFITGPFIKDGIKYLNRKRLRTASAPQPKTKAEPLEIVFILFLGAIIGYYLMAGRQYELEVRMLPNLVCWIGLALMACELVYTIFVHGVSPLKFGQLHFKLGAGRVPPALTLLFLFLMGLLVPVIGFIAVSVVIVAAIALMMNYKNWKAISGSFVFLAFMLFLFVRFLSVILPKGPWGF